jgi:uncharacterized repeat protein (TIGR02543 family)
MKNRKQFTFVAIIAIVGIIMGFVACDNNSGNNEPETFTVTFHANGGTPEPAQKTVEKDEKVSEPPAMTKTNNDFDGWYKESGFTTQWIFATNTVTANVDLYAKWIPYYGTLPNGIKIYKGEGAEVTDEQMATAVQNVIAGYNAINPDNYTVEQSDQIKTNITSKVIKIIIISDKPYTWNGSVLGIRYNRSAGICQGFFEMFLYDEPPFNE